jgi:vacuolar protein sorting-associated protein IST1
MKKISVNMPSDDLVEGYLTEIARGYGVQWNSNSKQVSEGQSSEVQGLVVSGLDGRGGTFVADSYQDAGQQGSSGDIIYQASKINGRETPRLPDIPPTEDEDGKGGNEGGSSKSSPEDDFAMLAKRFEALKKR